MGVQFEQEIQLGPWREIQFEQEVQLGPWRVTKMAHQSVLWWLHLVQKKETEKVRYFISITSEQKQKIKLT